jgi:hypothetical protein
MPPARHAATSVGVIGRCREHARERRQQPVDHRRRPSPGATIGRPLRRYCRPWTVLRGRNSSPCRREQRGRVAHLPQASRYGTRSRNPDDAPRPSVWAIGRTVPASAPTERHTSVSCGELAAIEAGPRSAAEERLRIAIVRRQEPDVGDRETVPIGRRTARVPRKVPHRTVGQNVRLRREFRRRRIDAALGDLLGDDGETIARAQTDGTPSMLDGVRQSGVRRRPIPQVARCSANPRGNLW